MLSISDASDLAQTAYKPTAIALLTLVVISSFLNTKALFNKLFSAFSKTFGVGDGNGDPNSGEKKVDILRITVLVFIVLAWPPFFYALPNMMPFNLYYDPEQFYLRDIHRLAEIACAYGKNESIWEAIRLVSTTVYEGDNAASVIDQRDRAFETLNIARALIALLILTMLAALFFRPIRDFNWKSCLATFAIILYTSFAAYTSIETAMNHEATSRVEYVRARIPVESETKVTAECTTKYVTMAEEPNNTRQAMWLQFGMPSLEGLIPR